MKDDSMQDRNGRLGRFLRAAQLFRPRTLAQLGKTDDRLQRQIHELSAEVERLKAQLTQVTRHERQLRAIIEAEYASTDQLTRFEAMVQELPIAEHVRAAIAATPIQHEPFPHCVIDNLLPIEYYEALIAGLPPVELFADRPENKQQLTVPLELAPRYPTLVWRHMARLPSA